MENKKVEIDGIHVDCAFDSLVDIESVKPNPKNPRKRKQRITAILAKIIKASGFRQAIVISNRSGLVTKGHGRLEACKMLNMKQIPVDFQDYDSDEQEMADILADNKIQEYSQSDDELTRQMLDKLKAEGFDIELSGFLYGDEVKLAESIKAKEFEEKIEKMEIQAFEHHDYIAL